MATERKSNDSTWENPFGARRTVPDHYNEMTVSLREKKAPGRRVDLVFRAYDEGVGLPLRPAEAGSARRIHAGRGEDGILFRRLSASAFALNMGRFNTQNEGEYVADGRSADIKPTSIINLPLLVEIAGGGPWVALLEADLTDYAGMYVGGVPGIPNALAAKLSTPP